MVDLVIKAARDLCIAEHVFVDQYEGSMDPIVTVVYPRKAVRGPISGRLFMETDLRQVKLILAGMATIAQTG